MNQHIPEDAATAHSKPIGAVLILAAGLTIVVMAQHPTGIDQMRGLGVFVHPVLMVLSALLFAAFAYVSIGLGIRKLHVLAALTAYAIATLTNIGAATISGLIVPRLAAYWDGEISDQILRLCWEMHQTLAGNGVFATGCAFILWGADLAAKPDWNGRALGLAGILPD